MYMPQLPVYLCAGRQPHRRGLKALSQKRMHAEKIHDAE